MLASLASFCSGLTLTACLVGCRSQPVRPPRPGPVSACCDSLPPTSCPTGCSLTACVSSSGPSQPELHLLVCTQIVNQLIANHKAQQQAYGTSTKPPADVNLNGVRQKISKQHGLKSLPRLMDILAAVPEEWKAILGSKLTIKPVRTASGASSALWRVPCARLRLLTPVILAFDVFPLVNHQESVLTRSWSDVIELPLTILPPSLPVLRRSPSSPSCASRTGVRTSP